MEARRTVGGVCRKIVSERSEQACSGFLERFVILCCLIGPVYTKDHLVPLAPFHKALTSTWLPCVDPMPSFDQLI